MQRTASFRFCSPRVSIASLTAIVLMYSLGWAEPPHAHRVDFIEEVSRSVVSIQGDGQDPDGNPGERIGTGVIIDKSGLVLTNHHVIKELRNITVTLSNGLTLPASIEGHSPEDDVAIIRITANGPLVPITRGTSADLMLGEPVFAFGNPYGLDHTVTEGIISGLNRNVNPDAAHNLTGAIQTDAALNPGSSGGPLVNADGQMIGVTVAVQTGAHRIGFVIPVDKAINTANRLIVTAIKTIVIRQAVVPRTNPLR